MMTDPIGGSSKIPAPSANKTSAVAGGLAVSGTDFLTLLVAQLKNQDPFNPSDPTQTVTQLASLSQLSTLQEISGAVKDLAGSRGSALDAAGWIGRRVLVESSRVPALTDGRFSGQLLDGGSSDLQISYRTPDGALVHTDHVRGPTVAGQSFSWDGVKDGVRNPGPLDVAVTSGAGTVRFAAWAEVVGVALPAQAGSMIETSVGSFSPTSVLDLR